MKHNLLKIGLLPLVYVVMAGSFLLGGCTKHFEEYNTDPYGISGTELAVDFKLLGTPLQQVQQNIYVATPAWNTQLQQNLIGDVFSGYMCPPTPFANNKETIRFLLVAKLTVVVHFTVAV